MKARTISIGAIVMALAMALLLIIQSEAWSQPFNSKKDQPENIFFLADDDLNTWLLQDENKYTCKVSEPGIQTLANQDVLFNRRWVKLNLLVLL
jgi:hypothetical protein